MKIEAITFNNDEMPSTVTVTMTIEQALWIARVSGQQKGESPHSQIYDCLCGSLFNRFWDDGVDDAKRDMYFEIPPIRYEEN